MTTSSSFEKPILNSPYEYPRQHWEFDGKGQPTNRILGFRRAAKYLTPIPKPKKQNKEQASLDLQLDKISTKDQQYDPTPIINELRAHVDRWRRLAPSQWNVTPETARQKEIDASIAAKADFEYLYDKPYEDKKKVRVAGPFTVESFSPTASSVSTKPTN